MYDIDLLLLLVRMYFLNHLVSKAQFQDWFNSEVASSKVFDKLDGHLDVTRSRVIAHATEQIMQLETKVQTVEKLLDAAEITLKKLKATGAEGALDKLVEQVTNEKLAIYNADQTNKVDYANYFGGGYVVYSSQNQAVSRGAGDLFSYLFDPMATSKPPVTMLDSKMTPGSCWPMDGDKGWAVVELRESILLSSISIEHIPRGITPSSGSAPKHVRVWGLDGTTQAVGASPEGFPKTGAPICELEYSIEGTPIQEVPCQSAKGHKFVGLEILSNHGESYTCVYRFRVHGAPTS
jgi:SUN domain-containing protein 1/2